MQLLINNFYNFAVPDLFTNKQGSSDSGKYKKMSKPTLREVSKAKILIDFQVKRTNTVEIIPIFRTHNFLNLSITQTKRHSLSSVDQCNFTPNFLKTLIFKTNFGSSKTQDSTMLEFPERGGKRRGRSICIWS